MSQHTLEGRGLVFGYEGQPVLTGANVLVAHGRRVALLGANASGKTTLLRCLSGSLRPASGDVLLNGTPLRWNRGGLRSHRQSVQLVLQDPDDQLFSADVRRDVSFGPLNLGMAEREVADRVDEALALLGISDLAERPVHQLSYGQRKRAVIAGAVAMQPRILLLDEPTAGLDPAGVQEMTTALDRLEKSGSTIVVATHNVDFALAWADQVALVREGQVTQDDVLAVLGSKELMTQARLRMPWVLELASRLPLAPAPTEHPRDLDTLVEQLMPLLSPDGSVHGRGAVRGGGPVPPGLARW